jgi:prophage maintenance system killer protein
VIRPRWILNRSALAAHRRLLAEHGGAGGHDLPRLAVALGWPKTVMAFSDARLSIFDLAAGYAEGMLLARPFESGNERMAYLLAMMFLSLNGVSLPAGAAEHLAMFRSFQMRLIDRSRYAQWMVMRAVAPDAGTVIGVRRNAQGRIVGLGLLRTGVGGMATRRRLKGPSPPALTVPMLQN